MVKLQVDSDNQTGYPSICNINTLTNQRCDKYSIVQVQVLCIHEQVQVQVL